MRFVIVFGARKPLGIILILLIWPLGESMVENLGISRGPICHRAMVAFLILKLGASRPLGKAYIGSSLQVPG
jgi:hypothetical protein